MIFKLCIGLIVYLPFIFAGVTKTGKTAIGKWEYIYLNPHPIFQSRHEVHIKPMRTIVFRMGVVKTI